MSTIQIEVTDSQLQTLQQLARTSGKTPEQVMKDAVEGMIADAEADEHQKFLEWKEALKGIEGMWADRDDLPDFAELRRSWDRDLWNR